MIEIRTKEQLSDFLDRYTFALKEQQDTILRIYALTRGFFNNLSITPAKIALECANASRHKSAHYASDLDESSASALAKLYIIRDGKIAFIDLYDDVAIKDITAQDAPDKSDEAPY